MTNSSTGPEIAIALLELRIKNIKNKEVRNSLISINNKIHFNEDEIDNILINSNSTEEKFKLDVEKIMNNPSYNSTNKKATVLDKRCNKELKKNIRKRREIKRQLIIDYLNENDLEDKIKVEKKIFLILDNYSTHKSKFISFVARILNICLIFLPPYSPHLNPIEQIWKDMKRELKKLYIESSEFLENKCISFFNKFQEENDYSKKWKEKFLI